MATYDDLNITGTLNVNILNVTSSVVPLNISANLTLETGNLFLNAISSTDTNPLAFSTPESTGGNITLSPQTTLALTISPTGLNLPSTSTLTLLNSGTAINASSATSINFSSATVTATTFSGTSVYASGTITCQNIYASDTISAATITGQNIYVSNAITSQNIYASSTITGQNIYASDTIGASTITGQNIYASNAITSQNIYASGTIGVQTITGQNIYASSEITCQNVFASNTITGQNIYASETISAQNITAQNIYATGIITGASMYATTFNGTATSVNVTDDNTATVMYLTGVQGSSSGSKPLLIDSVTGPLTYVPSTGLLTTKCLFVDSGLTGGATGVTGGATSGATFNSNIFLNGAITSPYTYLPIPATNQVGYYSIRGGTNTSQTFGGTGDKYFIITTTGISLVPGVYSIIFLTDIRINAVTRTTSNSYIRYIDAGFTTTNVAAFGNTGITGTSCSSIYVNSGTVTPIYFMNTLPMILKNYTTQTYYYTIHASWANVDNGYECVPSNSFARIIKIS
jgi:hypothetical protein